MSTRSVVGAAGLPLACHLRLSGCGRAPRACLRAAHNAVLPQSQPIHKAHWSHGVLRLYTSPLGRSCVRASALITGNNAFLHFSNRDDGEYAIGVMGDLHLEPDQMPWFHEARSQISAAIGSLAIEGNGRIVQLGDLGGYTCAPGSQECFSTANEFLTGFGVPAALITGNHDLEGSEFETDEENLKAWKESFCQDTHYWAKNLGEVLVIGLSTIRFRSNKFSVHEVFIDGEQLEWFEETVANNRHRPVVVCSHAPPIGCGLKVVQSVHVKNRCAWLNHSSNPGKFLDIIQKYGNIKLWFSGHFHLSHNYADSISVVGRTAFVQTGVIGECNRDGLRQSRILKVSSSGYEVYTIDHDNGSLRTDLTAEWQGNEPLRPVPLAEELLCDPEAGYLCGLDACEVQSDWKVAKVNMDGSPVRWILSGDSTLLAHQNDMLVEYDARLQAPIGVACLDTAGRTIRVVDENGKEVPDEDAAWAAAIELVDSFGSVERIKRNDQGSFYRIFQPNKWRIKKEKEAAMLKLKFEMKT